MCNGSSLTGATIKDVYRYFPYPQNYPYKRDSYALGYFPFTENPATAPRHLTLQGGDLVSAVTCDALLISGGVANGEISGSNRFTDLVLYNGSQYGTPLQLGHVIDTKINGVTAQGGICGAGNLPSIANYTIVCTDCTFTGNDCNYLAAYSITKMEHINFPGNNRYCIKSVDSTLDIKHVFVGNYGNDTCACLFLMAGDDGSTYSFEDFLLDFEGGGSFQRCLVYCEASPYTPTLLRLSRINGGQGGFNSVVKLLCGGNPPLFSASYLDMENVGADMFGSLIDVDGGNWVGTVKNGTADQCSYISSARPTGTRSSRSKTTDPTSSRGTARGSPAR